MHRSMTAVVVLAMVLVGCTSSPDPNPSSSPSVSPTGTASSPSPTSSTPPPGRVAVVVAPEPERVASAVEAGAPDVVRGSLAGTELRVVTADEPSFVRDLTTFFATEGYDLVCVMGAGAEATVRAVAAAQPSTRFCAAPAQARDLPENVLAIDVRAEELGYLAGVALAADGVEGPVGVVTAATTWAPARLQAGLSAGLAAGGVADAAVRPIGPPTEEEALAADLGEVLEQGGDGFVSLAGEWDAVVRDVLSDVPVTPPAPPSPPPSAQTPSPSATPSPTPTAAPERFAGLVAGPEAGPEEGAEMASVVLALVSLHLDEAVAIAVERHVEGWTTEPASVGLAEGAFRVHVGESERATAVAAAVREAVAALREGSVELPRP